MVRVEGKDKYAVKDAIEHGAANRDNVDIDNFDFAVTNKNAEDTFTEPAPSLPAVHPRWRAAGSGLDTPPSQSSVGYSTGDG